VGEKRSGQKERRGGAFWSFAFRDGNRRRGTPCHRENERALVTDQEQLGRFRKLCGLNRAERKGIAGLSFTNGPGFGRAGQSGTEECWSYIYQIPLKEAGATQKEKGLMQILAEKWDRILFALKTTGGVDFKKVISFLFLERKTGEGGTAKDKTPGFAHKENPVILSTGWPKGIIKWEECLRKKGVET